MWLLSLALVLFVVPAEEERALDYSSLLTSCSKLWLSFFSVSCQVYGDLQVSQSQNRTFSHTNLILLSLWPNHYGNCCWTPLAWKTASIFWTKSAVSFVFSCNHSKHVGFWLRKHVPQLCPTLLSPSGSAVGGANWSGSVAFWNISACHFNENCSLSTLTSWFYSSLTMYSSVNPEWMRVHERTLYEHR